MSPQHDWQNSPGLGSEAGERRDPADPGTVGEADAETGSVREAASAVEPGQPGAAGVSEGAGVSGGAGVLGGAGAGVSEEAGRSDEAGRSGEAEQETDPSARVHGPGGWSGRAVGPLSGLLPGGAAELSPGEVPAELSASTFAVDDETPLADDYESSTALPGDTSSEAQVDEAVEAAEETEPALTSTDDRWHAVLVGFVDDPRGSVEAARTLIEEDIAAHVALLARRQDAMHAAWHANEDADTEALRVALVKYRDVRKRLADVVSALTV